MEIITLASRAFATYCLLQTVLALFYSYKDCSDGSRMSVINRGFYVFIVLTLLYVIFFAIPAE